MKRLTTILPALLILLSGLSATAQKLPNVQKNSVRAPANVKIDGKATEWGRLQAFNSATEIYYTIANDDANLYLVVQADRPQMIQKTMISGINLTVCASANKNDKQQAAITFPAMIRADYQKILRIALSRFDGSTFEEVKTTKDTALKARQLDTLMRRSNDQIPANAKLINIKGMPGIQDTLVSIYNDYDIEVKCRFDKKMTITYEFAIPLKYLGLSAAQPGPFAYNIKLHGVSRRFINEGGGGRSMRVENGVVTISEGAPLRNQNIVGTTDFWGEYTLAK